MTIVNEILNAAKEHALEIHVFSIDEFDEYFENICKKFSNGISKYPLWDNLVDFSSSSNEKGWSMIAQFVGNNKCILFLEKIEGQCAIELENGDALNELLSNTFGYVFYVSNKDLEYLISFNDHDDLIGCGT